MLHNQPRFNCGDRVRIRTYTHNQPYTRIGVVRRVHPQGYYGVWIGSMYLGWIWEDRLELVDESTPVRESSKVRRSPGR